ncbi:unnamed protein product [Acanthoscelides obtectus]|uniref:Uncharacterized protein n=1 Tax=Acanthoscelides obtectus TaxID=200917 RepID=A0A9P0MBF1_ACAOB|nr:unnamed protein product [Acanthoscelides obtectus]CAK1652125.1 hypothetical protein AOBTE_LOCUS17700 [Acanthoscelides obtectus]
MCTLLPAFSNNYAISLWLSPLLKYVFRWTRDSDLLKVTWNYFEAEHGKGAAGGIGGFIKQTTDRFVTIGKDISDASSSEQLLKDSSKVKVYLILDEDFENMAREIPTEIVPLYGTMKLHQAFTEEIGSLEYRELSCFCQHGFCSCMCPEIHYLPKETIEQSNPATL